MFEFFAGGAVIFFGRDIEGQYCTVLGAETEQGIRAFANPNGTDTIHIESEDFGNFDIEIGDCEPRAEEAETPVALVRGIMNCFIESGNIFGGFDAKIVSEIPSGSGISETAAFEVLIGKIISGLFFENSVPELRLAQFGRTAEKNYFGRHCGLAERLISAAGGIVRGDFIGSEVAFFNKADFGFAESGYTVAVISGGEKADPSEDYYEIKRNLFLVAWNMGYSTLYDGSEAEFIAQFPIFRQKCGEKAVFDALHYYEEERTAGEAAEALESGDLKEFIEIYKKTGRTDLAIIPEEKAAKFAEEKEKQGFDVLFVL